MNLDLYDNLWRRQILCYFVTEKVSIKISNIKSCTISICFKNSLLQAKMEQLLNKEIRTTNYLNVTLHKKVPVLSDVIYILSYKSSY